MKITFLTISLILLLVLCGQNSGIEANEININARAKKIDKNMLARIIVSTDLEVDDKNGILLMLMYSNEFDIAGLVWSAGMFHFSGDGVHKLAEITPHFRSYEVEKPGKLMSFRPVEPGLLNRLISENYAADYKYLVQNDPNYPSPEELVKVVKVGNIEFEGDVRKPSEGSEWIRQCIMDDDPRPLYIQSWGGFNTVARALLSISEQYKGTSEWEAILNKVVNKVYIMGNGEDYSWEDNKIAELFPGLRTLGAFGGGFGNYFSTHTANPNVRKYYKANWLTKAFKFDHGKVLGEFHLMGDGQIIPGEPDIYQYGLRTYIDWETDLGMKGRPRYDFEKYDWMCCQFGGTVFIPAGLRGLENPNYGTWAGRASINGQPVNRAQSYNEYNIITGVTGRYNRFTAALFEDLASRADWAINTYENCNHPPLVSAEVKDINAKAGDVVDLIATAIDPDGNELYTKWWVWEAACEYVGTARDMAVWDEDRLATRFTVPADAVAGDYFNVILQVRDEAEHPMERYAQIIIKVVQ